MRSPFPRRRVDGVGRAAGRNGVRPAAPGDSPGDIHLFAGARAAGSPSSKETTMTQTNSMTQTDPAASEIRPFRVDIPEAALDDLKRRVAATNWPERETVADASQGVRFETIQALARYWATGHDWRKIEATLNAYPQFITEIDGLDIHFIHVKSKHENALPLIVT